jgi:hypothetical protein
MGRLAQEFGSSGRLLRDEDDEEEGGEVRLGKREEPIEEDVESLATSTGLSGRIAGSEGKTSSSEVLDALAASKEEKQP